MRRVFHHPIVRKHGVQFLRFAVCGLIGTTLDVTTLGILVRYADLSGYVGSVLSSLVGASFVFVANKFFTFRDHSKRVGNQIFKFALVYGIAIGLNVMLSWGFLWVLEHQILGDAYHLESSLLAKVGAIGVVALWNYTLSHGFIFKQPEREVAIV